jgi:hypothetical protein
MSNLNQELIYATAFIDAEGHIEFKTRNKKKVQMILPFQKSEARIEVANQIINYYEQKS